MEPITKDSHFSHVRPVTSIQRLVTNILTALMKDPQRPQTQGLTGHLYGSTDNNARVPKSDSTVGVSNIAPRLGYK